MNGRVSRTRPRPPAAASTPTPSCERAVTVCATSARSLATPFSQALGINDRRQIVGTSCDADFNCRAVVWRESMITNLNTLVEPGYGGTLVSANDVNESGRITGQALDHTTGALVAFVAQP